MGARTVGCTDVGILVDLSPDRLVVFSRVHDRNDPLHERRAKVHVHGQA